MSHPETLKGEGLRPGETHTVPAPEFTAPVTGTGSGVIPQPFDPLRSGYPGGLYPYPYNSPSLPYPYGLFRPDEIMNPY